jgi:glycerophosphoryl diester phosphodiesterase
MFAIFWAPLYTSTEVKSKPKAPTLIVAHRGASGLAPENTALSFKKAMDLGVDMIETDCRVTRDGVVVLVHDAHLTDQAGNRLTVMDSTYQDLLAHRPEMLTFDEAVALTYRQVRLMVEIKPGVSVGPVLAIIRKYLSKGWKYEDFIFASFDFEALKEVYAQMPQIERIVLEVWSGVRAVRRAKRLNTMYLSMDQWFLWWGFVSQISKRYKLFSYPDERVFLKLNHTRPSRWFKHGLYGVITDYPDRYTKYTNA